jgi:hypothetical protein
MRQWNIAEKIRDGVLDSAVRSPLWFTASLKINEESKITILTYDSMWEMRPFTRFMRFPRSSGYKNHSIKGAVCTFATSARTLQTSRRKSRTAPNGIPYFLQIMGSSDSYDRELDGTGAGIPSLPKIRIVDRSERSDADVNYDFIGIGIQRDEVD